MQTEWFAIRDNTDGELLGLDHRQSVSYPIKPKDFRAVTLWSSYAEADGYRSAWNKAWEIVIIEINIRETACP